MTVVAETTVAPRVAVAVSNQFYVRMAYVCMAIAVLGFVPTYWIPLLRGTLAIPPILHLHALFFYGWLALLIAQTQLAASRRFTRHRELGVFGVAVATSMCFVGVAAAVSSMKMSAAGGFAAERRAFSILPLSGVVFFAVLFTIAMLNVKRLDVHKRLMIVATVSLLQAAVGRWVLLLLAPDASGAGGAPPPVFVTVLPGVLSDLPLVWAMLHDRRTLGHVHRVYWIAGGALLALQIARVPLSTLPLWHSIADAVVSLMP